MYANTTARKKGARSDPSVPSIQIRVRSPVAEISTRWLRLPAKGELRRRRRRKRRKGLKIVLRLKRNAATTRMRVTV
jgi:hypothetical protein